MKFSIPLLFVLSLTAIVFGCTSENDSEVTEIPNPANLEPQLDLTYPFIMGNQKTSINMGSEKAIRQEGDFRAIPSQGGGSAYLVRTENGIRFQVNATGLTPGNAYTAWFRVVDIPLQWIIVHAAGNIVGASGKSTFAGSLNAGPIGERNEIDILINFPLGPFDEPMTSAVAVDIFDHGPAGEDGPGTIPKNIHEFAGVEDLAQVWEFCIYECPPQL